MPVYMYKCDSCKAEKRTSKPMKDCYAPEKCDKCGEVMRRDFMAEHGKFQHKAGNWPLKSDAMGVNPDQRQEAIQEAAKMGVPTDFTEGGEAVFTSRSHRKRYCEAIGAYDRDGGYSDPQRK